MREIESRWHRRRRGYSLLTAGIGLFGAFLVAGGVAGAHLAWLFVVLGFASLVFFTARALRLWRVDDLVFDQGQSGRWTSARGDSGYYRVRHRLIPRFRTACSSAVARD
jgi:hypothetical protein